MFSGTNVHETRAGNIKFSQHAEMSALREYIKFTYGKHCNLTTNFRNIRGKSPVIYVVRVMAVGYRNKNTNHNNICGQYSDVSDVSDGSDGSDESDESDDINLVQNDQHNCNHCQHTCNHDSELSTQHPLYDGCWFGNSLPCPDCQKNLKKYGIKTIKYTTVVDNELVLCELKLI